MDNIGSRLTTLRGDETQTSFADRLGINVNTLRAYEKGRAKPGFEVLETLCVKFRIRPAWILTGKGPMHMDEAEEEYGIVPPPSGAPVPPPPGDACARCARLESELSAERRERRELSAENRQLWKENGELREKLVRLELAGPPGRPWNTSPDEG